TFKAKVANRDGLWSDVKSLSIQILSPWWGTWWAKVVYILLFLLALYLYRMILNRKSVLEKNLVIAEKEMSLNKDKIKFFTNISHEIRTPLTLINGQLEDIQEAESVRNRYGGKLMAIRTNVNRLLNLTNLLLDFRKMESGNLKLSAAEGNFTNYSKEIYSFFLSLAEKKNINYTYSSSPKNIELTFDRNYFEIIITNLISNAFKYTRPGGSIAMQLKAIGDDKKPAIFEKVDGADKLSDNYLEISIQDNGIGMSNKELQKIFDRYYQARNLNTLSIEGTGIGLSLVKGLIELHKGEIEVESAETVGSNFIIKVPFGQRHLKEEFLLKDFKKSDHQSYYTENLPPDRKPKVQNLTSENFKKRILIVEDNPEISGYLIEHFESSFNVLQASNGKKALKQAKKYIPDIIISDVMMPEMDGLEMLKNLKNDPDLSYIPVILLTARTANLYEFKGIDIGAQDYITKPFSIKILKGKVDNILCTREKYKQYYRNRMVNEPSTVSLPNSEQKFLDDITNIVLQNLMNEDFSVKRLVREMGMSQSSCYKRLKELTGRSAVQFIRDVRLKRAGELLKDDRYNISEVAVMVGINDAQYFRKKFKEHFGCTPSELHANSPSLGM
ncbi:MAG: response regulator, partial [Pricia sp.]